jgi:uncharacterized membrane protein
MDTKTRSFLKSLSYRIFASIVTAVLVFIMTRHWLLAIGLGLLDSTVKLFVYFLHERMWLLIPFGRRFHPLEQLNVNKPLTAEDKELLEAKLSEMGYLGENI